MKKILALIVTVLMSMTLFVGCGNGQTSKADPSSLDKIKESGKLLVGLEDSFPPMEFRNEKNELIGFDIDIAQEIAKKLGVKSEIVTTSFDGIPLALKSNKFNVIISGYGVTPEREKEFLLTKPYIMNSQIIVVKNDNNSIKKSSDLKGKTVGVGIGTTSETAAKKIDGIKQIKTYDKTTEELQDLAIGRIDAVIVDEVVGNYYIANNKNYAVLDEKLTKEPMVIACKRESKELHEKVQKALDELKEEGILSKISQKWFGKDIYK